MEFAFRKAPLSSSVKLILLGILLWLQPAIAQQATPAKDSTYATDTVISKGEFKAFLKSPSSWIHSKMTMLSSLHLPQSELVDAATYKEKIEAIAFSGGMIERNLRDNAQSIRLRDINELQVELQSNISDLVGLRSKLEYYNNNLTRQTLEANAIEREIYYFNEHADTTIKNIYNSEIELLTQTLSETRGELSENLVVMVTIESRLNQLTMQLTKLSRYAQELALKKESELYKANLPFLWQSGPSNYANTFWVTAQKTIEQNFQTLLFFGKHSFIELILFRIFLFLLCMMPVLYYKKHPGQFNEQSNSMYLHKYPALASAVMGLVVSPIIFVNPPFAFLDLVLISLTISTSIIYIKENRHLPIKALVFVLVYYIVLKLINFLVTPTFYGRIIYSAAIVMVIPLYLIHDSNRKKIIKGKLMARFVFYFLLIQLIAGCTLSVIGYYSLGRIVMLSSIDAFMLALILNISVFTFLDYIRLTTTYLNKRIQTFSINQKMLEKLVSPMIKTLAVLFFIVSYLKNINLYDNFLEAIDFTLNKSREIGDTTFTYSSLLTFLIIIFLGFYFSRFIASTIEPNESFHQDKKRNSVGSYMLLIRFALMCGGFIFGIHASGIPLTQFTVVMGALGVGIGFGLQNIFNNLVSGLILAFERPISVGDLIEVGDETGRVKSIGIRATIINTGEGADISIPNGMLLSSEVKNWTLSTPYKMAHLMIVVANENDPELVQQLITDTLERHATVIRKDQSIVVLDNIRSTGMHFHVRFWVRDITKIETVRGEVMRQIYAVFKQNNISFPKPLLNDSL